VTDVRVGVVDVCVIRIVGKNWRVLLLRRAPDAIRPGSWEFVHGRIDKGETPTHAARRELLEETGLITEKLYSITVNPFYLLKTDTVQVAIVFAAIVDSERVTLGEEHNRFDWLSVVAAQKRLTWPRDAESLRHARQLLKSGNAGVVEDVLRAKNQ
jgi:8-oxo-dGTP pyrophosphatase MutT (NUDIX family)